MIEQVIPYAISGFFALAGAWLGSYIVNRGATEREQNQIKQEHRAARLQVFSSLRVLQYYVNYVHSSGDFNVRLGRLWQTHLNRLWDSLTLPAVAQAIQSKGLEKLLDCAARGETLLAFLESQVPLNVANMPKHASAAHVAFAKIRDGLDCLEIQYNREDLVVGAPITESVVCLLCQKAASSKTGEELKTN